MLKLVKIFKNTPKGRSELPSRPGAYNLKNQKGEVIYTGMTENLNRRIKEHHYDKSKHFAYITITPTKSKHEANMIENNRLKYHKSALNKKKK